MIKIHSLLLFILLTASTAIAQPLASPQVRADRETQWMKDSLKLPQAKLDKISAISLNYNTKMDSAAGLPDKVKRQKRLMSQKDACIKGLLTRTQYQRYLKREKEIRRIANIKYEGTHRPY